MNKNIDIRVSKIIILTREEGNILMVHYASRNRSAAYYMYSDHLKICGSYGEIILIYKNPDKRILDIIYILHKYFKLNVGKVLELIKTIHRE